MNTVGYRSEILTGAYYRVLCNYDAVCATPEAVLKLSKGIGTPKPVDFWWMLCTVIIGEHYWLDTGVIENWNRFLEPPNDDLDAFLIKERPTVVLECAAVLAKYREQLRQQYPLESIPLVASRELYDEMSETNAANIEADGIKFDSGQFGTGKRRGNLGL